MKSAEEAFLQVLSFSSRSTVPSNSASQLAYFREVAEQLGVSASALQRPFTVLSAGERQRVSLSWAVALHPLVLLLDEPTSHLDKDATARFEDLIKQVGSTVVCFGFFLFAVHLDAYSISPLHATAGLCL